MSLIFDNNIISKIIFLRNTIIFIMHKKILCTQTEVHPQFDFFMNVLFYISEICQEKKRGKQQKKDCQPIACG